MAESLIFIPDLSGFTEFVQSTEIEHSKHVVSELLEILIDADTLGLELAEIEGDALFFYKEQPNLNKEKLLNQISKMFLAFRKQLELYKNHRICPCNACATAPNLKLKIIVHKGLLDFIQVKQIRKPFGKEVIKAHRFLKNSVPENNYVLISESFFGQLEIEEKEGAVFEFVAGSDTYDNKNHPYRYSKILETALILEARNEIDEKLAGQKANWTMEKEFPLNAKALYEYISNYKYRPNWVKGPKFKYRENEVTRIGSEHMCVIGSNEYRFTTITKEVEEGQLIYGEHTSDPFPVDDYYLFYILTPLTDKSCMLKAEVYSLAKSPVKKLVLFLFASRSLQKNISDSINNLFQFVKGLSSKGDTKLDEVADIAL